MNQDNDVQYDDFEIRRDDDHESLEALSDHLILESAIDNESRTPSGLLIPASAAKQDNGFQRFRVIAAGPVCNDERVADLGNPTIEPGDLVLAPADDLGIYRESGQTYYIASYDMIAAVIREA